MKKTKFKVEPFRHAVKADPDYREKTWAKLEEAINQINNLNASGLSFEELYRSAYNMVINKFGDRLYTGVVKVMTEHLRKAADEMELLQGDHFLREMKARWDHHTRSMQMIRDILMYMDRIYVKAHNKTSVGQLGLDLWCQHVIRRPTINTRLLSILLDMIQRERAGEVVARSLVREIAQMLMHLGPRVYMDDFEIPFLRRSAHHYRYQAEGWIATCDCPTYLEKAEVSFAEEGQRVGSFLDPSTEPKIIEVLEEEIIQRQMEYLVEMDSGLVCLMREGRVPALSRMYNLFKRVKDGLMVMRQVMGEHLKEMGKAMVLDTEKLKEPVDFMTQLLEMKLKYDGLIRDAFNSDKTFQNTLNQAFEHFLNLQPRTPEYMSLYLDDKLKKGSRGGTEEEQEASLDHALLLFRYLSDKDIFEKYYKQHLSRRLLSGKGVSDDAERYILVKLKSECGYQFTNKLESMFTDIRTSRDMMQNYKRFAEAKSAQYASDLDLSVQVLTTGSWPGEQPAQCILPPEVSGPCEQFKEFYTKAYSGRRLIWQTNKGSADIKANFPSRKHDLNMNTHQMCICMLFNDNDSLSFSDIQAATKIPDSDLKRSLQSLACAKGRNVLRKEPVGREVEVSDMFHYNDQFQNKMVKLKIGTISASKESEPAFAASRLKAEEDRKPLIESAIVRIMKSRKRLDHNSVVTEVTRQLASRFTITPVIVKKHIEGLIQREYLERDSADWKYYKYIA